MDTLYKIVTDQGAEVWKGENGAGLSEAQATSSVEARNAEAVRLGIKTRYVVDTLLEALAA